MAEYSVKEAANKNDIKIVLGDAASSVFVPRLKFKRWDEEVEFGIGHDLAGITGQKNFSQSGEKYILDTSRLTLNFYPKTDAYEFDLVLKRKPPTNVISLPISSRGLDFFYQPPLTEEYTVGQSLPGGRTVASVTETEVTDNLGAVCVQRPANVVGSYAVYHSLKSGDFSRRGGYNYRAGKAFHIYRPLLTDALGATAWATLNVNTTTGRLTITAPQSFLDSATYPVTVDPTFGYSSIGASSDSGNSGLAIGNLYAMGGAEGTASSIKGCFWGGVGDYVAKMAAYLDGSPKTFVANSYSGSESGPIPVNKPTQDSEWTEGIISATFAASTNYWLISFFNSGSIYWACDTGQSAYYQTSVTYSTAPPASLTLGSEYASHKFSIYVTYAAGGETHSGSAAVSGNGSVAGSAQKGGRGIASIAAAGAIVALGFAAMSGTAAISAGGALAALGKKTAVSASGISAGGVVATSEKKGGQSPVAISGGGSIATSAIKAAQISSAVPGGGAIAAVGKKSSTSATAVSGSGTIVTVGTSEIIETHSGAAAISGNGALAVSGMKGGVSPSAISTAGELTTAGVKSAFSITAVSAAGTVTASSLESLTGVAAISGGGSVAVVGTAEHIDRTSGRTVQVDLTSSRTAQVDRTSSRPTQVDLLSTRGGN